MLFEVEKVQVGIFELYKYGSLTPDENDAFLNLQVASKQGDVAKIQLLQDIANEQKISITQVAEYTQIAGDPSHPSWGKAIEVLAPYQERITKSDQRAKQAQINRTAYAELILSTRLTSEWIESHQEDLTELGVKNTTLAKDIAKTLVKKIPLKYTDAVNDFFLGELRQWEASEPIESEDSEQGATPLGKHSDDSNGQISLEIEPGKP